MPPAPTPSKLMVLVNVESAWASKINWAQAVGLAVSLMTVIAGAEYDVSPEKQAMIVVSITTLQSMMTVVLRTFFTTMVTPQSVSSTPETIPPVLVPPMDAKKIMVDAVEKKI